MFPTSTATTCRLPVLTCQHAQDEHDCAKPDGAEKTPTYDAQRWEHGPRMPAQPADEPGTTQPTGYVLRPGWQPHASRVAPTRRLTRHTVASASCPPPALYFAVRCPQNTSPSVGLQVGTGPQMVGGPASLTIIPAMASPAES